MPTTPLLPLPDGLEIISIHEEENDLDIRLRYTSPQSASGVSAQVVLSLSHPIQALCHKFEHSEAV